MLNDSHIIIFTRFPVPGKTKTRLIPSLGPKRAAELQRNMTEKVAKEALIAAKNLAAPVSIFYTNGTEDEMRAWLGDFHYYPQVTGDIGVKMSQALRSTLKHDVSSAILVGSDIPGITAAIIENGIFSLKRSDVVLGPSVDGGYYLIGMNHNVAEKLDTLLFSNIPWSTGKVLTTTTDRLKKCNVSFSLLQPLQDIDSPEDISFAKNMKLI